MKFQDKFEKAVILNNSLLCIGLDPDFEKLPGYFLKKSNPICEFNKGVIDKTHHLVCAYKPNIAFYEAAGIEGLRQLKKTIDYLKKNYPVIPIVLDAKRADIPNTARMYAKSAFEFWQADAVTVYPHLGLDSVLPFLEYKDKLTILLIKTSNPDSKMFQDLPVDGEPFYLKIAQEIQKWPYENFGIFVGATYPGELKKLREIFPDRIFLSAGLGTQGAQIKKAVRAGINDRGEGIMFNASRSVLYVEDPQAAAQKLKDEINKYR